MEIWRLEVIAAVPVLIAFWFLVLIGLIKFRAAAACRARQSDTLENFTLIKRMPAEAALAQRLEFTMLPKGEGVPQHIRGRKIKRRSL